MQRSRGHDLRIQRKPVREGIGTPDLENAFDVVFPDTQAMIGWVDQPSLVPFLQRVPRAERPAFRQFVVAQMIRRTRRPDGRCCETFRRLNVIARK